MGQIPSEPITQKETHGLGSDAYRVGSSCMQGWRATMEDAHTHILSLPGDPAAAFFAVFDGHGGDKVAEFASRHLHTVLVGRPEYSVGRLAEALQQACLQLDRMMLADETLRDVRAGTTAVCALIKDGVLYCANAGDSRAVASVCGRAEPLSVDHKPQDRREQERITAAGGSVVANRVNGYLALSRALGDFTFKQNSAVTAEHQVVTAFPDVETRQITADWEFVILACDGIWDVMSNQSCTSLFRPPDSATSRATERRTHRRDSAIAAFCCTRSAAWTAGSARWPPAGRSSRNESRADRPPLRRTSSWHSVTEAMLARMVAT